MAKFSKIEKDGCISCGVCVSMAPDIFDFDDDGYAENIFSGDGNSGTVEISEDFHDDLIEAAEGCPTEVVKVSDSPFS